MNTPDRAPNIVYLHSHDTGRLIQPYGHAVPTPHLQGLAEHGVTFRNAHAAGPTCSPSRAALLTGQCPHRAGMLGLAHRGFRLTDPGRHLAHTLRTGGYHSALAGLQHVAAADAVESLGYDRVLGESSAAEENAVAFLRETATRDRPFFLDVGFFETHRRGGPGGHYSGAEPVGDPRYVSPPASLPDAPATRADMADFAVAAERLDAKIGSVLGALEDAGLAEETLVIYTTDHGPPFPGMKCSLTGRGTGVSLIMRGPGGFAGGRVSEALVSHVDLFPTLCEVTGVPAPSWLEGRSLLPLANGEATELHDEVFSEVSYHAAYEPKRAVRTGRYTYIRNFGDRARPVLPNCDDGPSKSFLLDHDWAETAIPPEELYDTVADPVETDNRAGDAAYAEVLADLRWRLDAWMARTDDPLLDGPVPLPGGAQVNDPAGGSPQDPTTSPV